MASPLLLSMLLPVSLMLLLLSASPFATGAIHIVEVNSTLSSGHQKVTPPAGFNISAMSSLNFALQACQQGGVLGKLMLSKDPDGGQPFYEITISDLYAALSYALSKNKNGKELAQAGHPTGSLNCSGFHPTFVSWEAGVVKVGAVGGGKDSYLSYTDAAPFPVHFVSVTGVARWRFEFQDLLTSTTVSYENGTSTEYTDTSTESSGPSTPPVYQHTGHYCSCRCRRLLNTSRIEPQDPAQIASRLLIPTNSTSAARRRRTSAQDDRPSSTTIGAVGVVCLVCPVLVVVCFDLTNFYEFYVKGRVRAVK